MLGQNVGGLIVLDRGFNKLQRPAYLFLCYFVDLLIRLSVISRLFERWTLVFGIVRDLKVFNFSHGTLISIPNVVNLVSV